MSDKLIEQLRLHARSADFCVVLSGAPYAEAADEIERLRTENTQLATFLLSQKVFVHETIITEVDETLKPHIGGHQ